MTDTSTALERVEADDLAERKRLNRMLLAVDVMAKGSLLKKDLREDGNARTVAITLDQLGVPPTINNMNACFVINGAVGMMTWLWCAVASAHGGHEVWLDEDSDAERGIAHLRRGDTGTVRTVVFTIEDARRAGLTTGPNKHNYEKYATDMLGWRALSRVVKRYAPEVMAGLAAAGAIPEPVMAGGQREQFLVVEDPDDEIIDGEIVEQGEDPGSIPHATTAPPGPGTEADAEELAAYIRWKRAGKPRDENGFIIDVPEPAAEEPEEVRDNGGTDQIVDGSTAPAPPRSGGPVDWRELAKRHGVTVGGLLIRARSFAEGRGMPAPAAIEDVTDEQVIADVMDWLGEP